MFGLCYRSYGNVSELFRVWDLFLIPQASSSPLLIVTCALLMNNILLSRSRDQGAMELVGLLHLQKYF